MATKSKPHVHTFKEKDGHYKSDPITWNEIWEWLFDECIICHERRKHVPKGKHPGRSKTVIIGIGPIINCTTGEITLIEGVNIEMDLLNTDKVVLTAHAADADGNPTAPTFVFVSSDETVVSITDNGDGTAVATSGAEGTATVTATATDADGHTVDGTLDITVVPSTTPAAETATVTIVAGTPEPK